MTIRAVAVVSGHLQGVGGSGVLSGRVEVALEGADDDVRAAVAALSGPGAPGTVTSVDVRDEPARGSSGFTVA